MTTEKQSAANKANAKKSTGAKTPEGKQVVSMNAVSHGLLASRLFLEGESPAEFQALQEDLRRSLKPVGALELALTEKIAVALWKQRRMVAAESASIELGRSFALYSNRKEIKVAMGLEYTDTDIEVKDLSTTAEDQDQVKWCNTALAEFKALGDEPLLADDLQALAKQAPTLWEQFKSEAEEEKLTPEAYLATLLADNGDGLMGWAYGIEEWAEGELKRQSRKGQVQVIANMVQQGKSAPIGNELMLRYQVALDAELYRAADALRKQQEWRTRAGIEIDAEVVDG